MKFLNLSFQEIFFLVLLALLIFGPRDIVNTARKMGRFIYRLRKNPVFQNVVKTSKEIQDLPKKIIREAGLEETLEKTNLEVNPILKETREALNQNLATEKKTGSTVTNRPVQPSFSATFSTPAEDSLDNNIILSPTDQESSSPNMESAAKIPFQVDQYQRRHTSLEDTESLTDKGS